MELRERIRVNQNVCVMGIDDAPFAQEARQPVLVSGIVCSNTRFEGMLRTYVEKDGHDATQVLKDMIGNSKFYRQLHAVLLDGMTMGGFNVVNVPYLAQQLQRPFICVIRRPPNLDKIYQALQNLNQSAQRWKLFTDSGIIHQRAPFVFQCYQCSPASAYMLLKKLTLQGHVPEPLRMAHLINSAVVLGQSNNKA